LDRKVRFLDIEQVAGRSRKRSFRQLRESRRGFVWNDVEQPRITAGFREDFELGSRRKPQCALHKRGQLLVTDGRPCVVEYKLDRR
jgi:hypothetical protein